MRLCFPLLALIIVWGGEPVGVDVGFEMVDGVKGFIPEDGKGTSSKSTDEEGTE